MGYKLVIVESPTKITSIGKYLDSDRSYKIASSMGHVRDLSKKDMGIDIENNFQPNYQISPDKQKIVKELKKLVKEASEVIMASDEDREGEAIAWHLCHILNLDPKTTKRIVFHEITKTALEQAIANPRTINQDLVNAQQARRIMDRIIGFKLSPLLWRKIASDLSAGRVQSVAMRLIYERELEIKNFKPQISYQAKATFRINQQEAIAQLNNKINSFEEGRQFLEACRLAYPQEDGFKIIDKTTKPSLRNPSPPFKTSTLQQEASQKLGFSIKQTMRLAQKLYEAGFITYMRTDSLNLSQEILQSAKTYIVNNFGDQYHQLKMYQTKNQDAQEAHEAIRPTDINQSTISDTDEQIRKLYQLIHRRTLASQMTPAKFNKTTIVIQVKTSPYKFSIDGQTLEFDGFLKINPENLKDVLIPDCQIGQFARLIEANIFEKFSNHPARFTEASLVRKLEESGIGRPSTYVPTINTLIERKYVIKGEIESQFRIYKGLILQNQDIKDYQAEDKYGGGVNKLIPTNLAELVTPFLKEHIAEIMDYDFTSKTEADFDLIAQGQLDWVQLLQNFYDKLQPSIEKAEEISKQSIMKMRQIGQDPQDNQIIYARQGRHGTYLQKGLAEDSDKKPPTAPLPTGTNLEDVTLEQALKMFKLPRLIGLADDQSEILAKIGPFGPYLENQQLRIPLKEYDPFSIDLSTALNLIAEKKESNRQKVIAEFGDLKILRGRFGPYITDGKKNAPIPKEYRDKPETINQHQTQTWLDEKGKLPGSRSRKKISKTPPKS